MATSSLGSSRIPAVDWITEGFSATTDGNSLIQSAIELPNRCVAQIVMVLAGSEDKWFAMTGFEAEEDQKDDFDAGRKTM